jgi:chitodextrinase
MLEHFTDTYLDLMDDLQQAHISSYQRWAYTATHFSAYLDLDLSDLNNPIFNLHDEVRAMPQVFKYVRFNALQIGVTSGNGVAYINQNGGYAVILENTTLGPHNIIGLPAGTYSIASSGFDVGGSYLTEDNLPDVTINQGETLTFTALTTGGLITVFSKLPIVPDTTPPSTPNNLQGTAISDTTIDLIWDASTDNIAVAGYRLYRDGSEIATTTGTVYRDMGLVELTQYDYTVSAYDFATNESNQSTPLTITTLVRVNQPPIANAGADQNIFDSNNDGTETVTLDGSGSSDPDGAIVSYTWRETTNTIATGINPVVNLAIGSHSIELTVVDNDGATSTSTVVISIIDTSNTVHIWLEAESANPLTTPMQILNDPNASDAEYISNTNGGSSYDIAPINGRASYNFTIPIAGNYKIWGRVIAPVDFQDSFWIKVDNGDWMTWAVTLGSTWFWDDVSDFGQGAMIFPLISGNHILTIAYREENTKLDKLFITNDATIPTGVGDIPTSAVIFINSFE